MPFKYFLLPEISFVVFFCSIPLFLLCLISVYLHPNPEIQLMGFYPISASVSISVHHTCHIWPQMKGHAYFPDALKTHLCIFFLQFPWLVSIIQAPFLNWNFPCSCILTCWFNLLCSAVFLVWACSSQDSVLWFVLVLLPFLLESC